MRSSELRIMALRQKQQIDKQQQLLAAREQRLRFLKTQEANDTAVAAEGERLRRLRERVEAQESKLRRLRALRGQVDLQKTYNVSLGNDLDSIRALFSEKEKELTLAVAKVEALTRQLEDLRRDRRGNLNYYSNFSNHCGLNNSSAAIELENLRSELMYRNQLQLQQDARLHLQRDALQKRQAELQSVDQRILELQGRLNKKRSSHVNLNQSTSKTPILNNNAGNHVRFHSQNKGPRNNVVAVGPFNHFPEKIVTQGTIRHKPNVLSNSNAQSTPNPNTYNFIDNKSRHNCQKSTDGISKAYGMDYSMAPESDEHKLAAKQNKMIFDLKKAEDHEYINASTADENCNSHKTTISGTEQDLSQVDQKFENDEHINNQKLSSNNEQIISKATLRNQDETINECDSDKVCDSLPRAKLITPVHRSVAIPMIANQEIISSDQNLFGDSPQFYPKTGSSNKSVLSANSNEKMIHMVVPQSIITDISTHMESTEKIKPALPPKPSKPNVVLSEADISSETSLDKKASQTEHLSQNMAYFSKASGSGVAISDSLPIKARPLTIKKSPYSEHPRLKHCHNGTQKNQSTASSHRTIEMPQTYGSSDKEKSEDNSATEMSQLCFQTESDKNGEPGNFANRSFLNSRSFDETEDTDVNIERAEGSKSTWIEETSRRKRSFISSVSSNGHIKFARRVSFDPLALLLDASLEGELELVKITASQVSNPSAANDEGITALHNAICAGHVEIVKFLVEFGCDVNAQDSDGWTPLHCAASCNNLSMVKFLVESGASLFAKVSDNETPAEKCEEDEEGFDACSEYLYSIQEKLGILHNGEVYAVYSYEAQQPDELSFSINDKLVIIRKGDESEREWWWARDRAGKEGYIPRNLLGLHPRINPSYNITDQHQL
uniref:Putative apoptosis-stimulating of p53 protein 2 n=1 Tax=Culex tarsalis TaxID=7177 RepID=A0A1Q3G429_CULTA